MGRLGSFRHKEVVKRLRACGFSFYREAKGSHEIWYCQETDRYATIPKHRGDMREGTLRSVLRQAGITPDEFLDTK